jgi:hypothetical protein
MADRDGKPYHRAFEVDGRIVVKIDVELAYLLGALILSTDTTNPALLAIGHQLRSFTDYQPDIESQPDDE